MSNHLLLFSLLFEADAVVSDMLGDFMKDLKKEQKPTDNSDPSKDDSVSKKLDGVLNYMKKAAAGQKPTRSLSTTSSSAALPKKNITQGILAGAASKPTGTQSTTGTVTKPEVAALTKALTTDLARNKKFIGSLAKQLTITMQKDEK